MADTKKKKTTGSKSNPKKTDSKKTEPKKTEPQKGGQKKNDPKAGDDRKSSVGYNLIPYVLAVLALFLMICFISNLFCNPSDLLGKEGRQADHTLGIFGYWVCNIFMGIFGPAAFAIPVIFALFVVFWKNYNRRSFVTANTVMAIFSMIIVAALIHTFTYIGGGKDGFPYHIDILYKNGAALIGGGVVGGYAAYGLVSVLNIFGTIFVLIATLIPLVLFLFGTTPVGVVRYFVAKGKESAAKKRAEKVAAAEEEDGDDEEPDEDDDEEVLVVPPAVESEKPAKGEKPVKSEKPAKGEKPAKAEKPAEVEAPAEVDEVTEPRAEEEEEKLVVSGLPTGVIIHSDEIKESDEKTEEETDVDAEDVEDVEEIEENINLTTVVFVDPQEKGGKKRGHKPVDNLVSERFDDVVVSDEEEVVVDTETGEVFTPVVKSGSPRSAAEFRAENETHEDCFVGDKPEPIPVPDYNYPPVDLLEKGSGHYATDPEEVRQNAELLRDVLQDFRIPVKEISYSCGPTITRFEVKPEAGVRVRQIAGLVDDISLGLAKSGVRIEAPIPGKAAVGIEVPNDKPLSVKLRNLIECEAFTDHKSKLAACLGADVSGNPVVFDIEKMPHLLVAGTTGSGKSVCINSIIMSIMYHARPDEVKLLLIDPKQVEFQIYRDIPHLCCRIISNPKKAAGALNSAVNEMEKRFELIKEVGVRNITGYNEATKNDPEKPYMPRLVIIIDEFADLMMTAKEEVETAVVRIAQKARAAGIHLIIGTQRPSVDVITGLIKANIPSRIAFTVMSGVDSRTILDTVGAEKLCGRGDMLYSPVGSAKPQRVQGAFVSDGEVEAVVEYVKANNHPVIYDQEFESSIENEATSIGSSSTGGAGGEVNVGAGDEDALLLAAAELAIDSGKIATSMLQRRLSVGYGRAAKIIDRLEEMGVVGPPDGTKPRQVLMSRENFMLLKEEWANK